MASPFYLGAELDALADSKDENQVQDLTSSPTPAADTPNTGEIGPPPDGGTTAWLAVVGGWCCLFASFGWITCIGVFQAHYEQNQLRQYSPALIGWIPSVETFFLFVGAPLVGKVFDSYGPRPLLIVGTLFHVLGLMILSLCKQYYQFFLAQSVCSAMGASAVFWAANNAVGTWFGSKRGLAMGIMSAGSSVGGVVGTAALPTMITNLGFGWAVRIMGFIYLALLSVALFTVKSRLNHTPSKLSLSEFVMPMKQWSVVSLAISGFLFFLGVFLPYNFLVVEAEASGMDGSMANNLLVILSATSVCGRIVPGWAGDAYGRFNVTIVFTLLSSLFTLAIWLPANNGATRMAFAGLYGFSSGTFVSMIPTLIVQICPDMTRIGLYMGAVYIIQSPTIMISQPVGGSLAGQPGLHMMWMKVFAGLAMFAGGLMFMVARAAHLKNRKRTAAGEGGVTELLIFKLLERA
ncbi:MFS general substrate transporter [Periconia macrospinosa]|uniref:MFS general substrate transporter n=1 Tax=Periconia macrospinosa TaxID=97972 RepID=A0A2V1DFP5_9PLEO|nr:MFS general substrate transporter [Periconia macrospinosa]